MKNTFLKKAGAVALAAVMAVTFAPVASLNAFATESTRVPGTDANGIIKLADSGTTATITQSGIYVVSDKGITVTVSGSGVTAVTLRLAEDSAAATYNEPDGSSKGTKVIVTDGAVNARITVEGTKGNYTAGTGWTLPSVSFVKDPSAKGAQIRLSGEMLASGPAIDVETAFGSTPVAHDGTTGDSLYYVGTNAINNINEPDAGGNVFAVNGAVKVDGLKKGHIAGLDDDANVGTTIDATAAKDTTLTKVVTTYNYKFWSTVLGTYGTSSYVDTRFAAGAASWNDAFDNANGGTLPNVNVVKKGTDVDTVLSGASISTKALSSQARPVQIAEFSYDRAITLKEDDHDKFAQNIELPYVDGSQESYKYRGDQFKVSGITYFTADPTKYTLDTTGVALIDGTKYVIDTVKDDNKELYNVSSKAKKSLAILRGTSQDARAINAWNLLKTKEGVKVTAPTSSSIALGHTKTIGTKWTEVGDRGIVFGSNNVQGAAAVVFGSEENVYDNGTVETTLEVPQVAAGTYAIVNNAFTDTKVTAGTGITYFYEQKTSQLSNNNANYVFGSLDDTTNALNAVLTGKNLNTTNYFTQATAGENVYVAKDIKGTFKGVAPKVTVKGEISADGSKAADGSYTWVVNLGYASDAVTAYRMYRKSGEHVYTINPDEVSMLVNAGWINEGEAFKVNSVASKKGTPIYRVYNPNNGGMHFYTASAAEKDMLLANGWTEGKVVFYGADKATGIPVYRTYNTGSNNGEHNYTTNIAEADMNVKAGWRAEGVAFYVFK